MFGELLVFESIKLLFTWTTSHLAMVVRQQKPFLEPLDGVVRVANHTTVYESVPSCYGCEVLHGSDTRRT